MRHAFAVLLLGGCDIVLGLKEHPPDASTVGMPDGGPDDGAITPIDAQPPSRIVFKFLPGSVCQGRLAAGSVYLTEAPSGSLTVTIASTDAAVAIEAPQVVTFTATNWNQPITLTARGVNVSASPVPITASAPGENTVHDGLLVTGPC